MRSTHVFRPFPLSFAEAFCKHPRLYNILEQALPDNHLIRLALMSEGELASIPGIGPKSITKILKTLNTRPRDEHIHVADYLHLLFRDKVEGMPAGLLTYLDFDNLLVTRQDTDGARILIETLQSIFDDYELTIGDILLFTQEDIIDAVTYKLFETLDIDPEVAATGAQTGMEQLRLAYFEFSMAAETKKSLAVWQRAPLAAA